MAKMSVMEMFEKVQKAKQVQAANRIGEKMETFAGITVKVEGIEITDVVVNKIPMQKTTLICQDNVTISGFHLAAAENARDITENLGEGPYPYALLVRIDSVETTHGTAYFPTLVGVDLPEDFDPVKETAKEVAEKGAADFLNEIEGDQPQG